MKRSPLQRKESTGNSPGPSPAVAAFAEAFVIFALFLAVKTAGPPWQPRFSVASAEKLRSPTGFRSAKASWIVSPVSAVILVLIISLFGRCRTGSRVLPYGMTSGNASLPAYFGAVLFGLRASALGFG